GHRRRASAARAARRPLRVPGVAGDAGDLRTGEVERAELRGGGLADGHRPGRPQPGDVDRVLGHRTPPGEGQRAAGRGHAGAVLQVLDPDGHPGERTRVPPGGHRGVDLLGGPAGQVLVHVDERPQAVVRRPDGGQGLLEHLDRPALAPPDRLGDLDRRLPHHVSSPVGSVAAASSSSPAPASALSRAWARSSALTLSPTAVTGTASTAPKAPNSVLPDTIAASTTRACSSRLRPKTIGASRSLSNCCTTTHTTSTTSASPKPAVTSVTRTATAPASTAPANGRKAAKKVMIAMGRARPPPTSCTVRPMMTPSITPSVAEPRR